MSSYPYEEVKAKTLEYFRGDDLAADAWINKYCLKDGEGKLYEQSPDDMHKRLAKEFHRIELKYPNPLSEEEIYSLLKDFKYIVPQGSPMHGIGNHFVTTSLSNCFVIPSAIDSYGGVMHTDQEQVQLMKRRGGVGHDLSNIRPSGALANNSVLGAHAGMPLYMKRFSNSTREVSQDGRRGALMLSVNVKHPDTEKFIDAKLKTGEVTGANISVKLTDEFMQALNGNTNFIQTFPIDLKLDLSVDKNNGLVRYGYNQYFKSVDPKIIWNKIIKNAHKSAEPGVLFWDKILKESPAACYGEEWKEISTNPCFVGDTIIAVADGRNGIPIKQLANEGKDVFVYCMDNDGGLAIRKMRNPRLTGKNKKIYKLTLDSGDYFRCTSDHKFYLKDGNLRQVKDLVKGDSLQILSKVKDVKFNNKKVDLLSNGESVSEHRFLYESLVGEIGHNDIHHLDEDPFNNSLDNLVKLSKAEHNKIHNKSYSGESNGNYSGISNEELKNIFTIKTKEAGRRLSRREYYNLGGVGWSKYRKELGESVDDFLKNLAINLFKNEFLYNYDNRLTKGYIEAIENGYLTKIEGNKILVEKVCENCGDTFWVNYRKREVSFCGHSCAINKLNKDRWGQAKDLHNQESEFYNHKVVSVEEDGYEDVYNGTVDEFHNFYAGEFLSKTIGGQERLTYCVSRQCGEIPIPKYDSCRLLAVNLYSYVQNPFTDKAYFDFELFRNHVVIAQRLMDDLIDLEIEKLDKIIEKINSDPESEAIKAVELNLWQQIREKAVQGRRTGLGITAEGDMLAALGFRYGTKKATLFSVNVHKELATFSYNSSTIMAKERGAFPIWDYEKEKSNPFINRVSVGVDFDFGEYINSGRRNIALLTIAPTGTTSLMTQTSSGIEPVFLPLYKRRKKTDNKEKSVFVDETGDMWEEYIVFHHKFIEWYNVVSNLNSYSKAKFALENTSEDMLEKLIQDSPYYKATSADIDWKEAVVMQGEIQKWVDHSISKTINLPENTPVKTVDALYKLAYKVGCKGVTVYRDGSRSGVLISNKEEKKSKESIVYRNSPKRPKEMPCHIYTKTALGKQWTVLVGLLDRLPYEVFAFEQLSQQEFPKEIKRGVCVRIGRQNYRLIGQKNNKEYVIDNIIKLMAPDEQYQTRDFSRSLRHGEHPKYIVSDIDKSSYISSFRKVIGRVLNNYLNDEDIEEQCPECGDKLVFEEGCKHCNSCAYSKCG